MNILLWVIQVVVAMFCVAGAAWRFTNYEEASKQIASLGALPYGAWNAIGAFEVVCALGLILPGLLKLKSFITPAAAACLCVELLLVSALHIRFFGLQMQPSNPATWTLVLAGLSAFIAYGRFALRPL